MTRRASERLVLDTHIWKDYVDGTKLSAKIVRRIDAAREREALFISAITPWEIARLARDGRLKLNGPTLQWVTAAVAMSGVCGIA